MLKKKEPEFCLTLLGTSFLIFGVYHDKFFLKWLCYSSSYETSKFQQILYFPMLTITGHALEARIYAENVPKGFLPATGVLHHYQPVPVTSTGQSCCICQTNHGYSKPTFHPSLFAVALFFYSHFSVSGTPLLPLLLCV